MEEQGQKGVYQIAWTNPGGEIKRVALLNANSPEAAMKWEPELKGGGKKRSVRLVDEKRLRSLLGLLGMPFHEDLFVWFHVDIEQKKNEYGYMDKYVRVRPDSLVTNNSKGG